MTDQTTTTGASAPVSPTALSEDQILGLLGLTQDDVPRYRHCWVDEDDGERIIIIRTRTGGGNRSDYGPEIARLYRVPGFLREEEDDFDRTYTYFHYAYPAIDPAFLDEMVAVDAQMVGALADRDDTLCVQAANRLRELTAENAALREERNRAIGQAGDAGCTANHWQRQCEVRDERIETLTEALRMARCWGIASRNYDSTISRRLGEWVRQGMSGPLPEVPDFLQDIAADVDTLKETTS